MEAASITSGGRSIIARSPLARLPDQALRYGLTALAALILALIVYFVIGLVLAIMILPIVSAISREVMATVPADHKEAALGLGATRWEMIRIAVLPFSRSGIVGGAMLGLGRALGETIAVTILIGDAPKLVDKSFHHSFS